MARFVLVTMLSVLLAGCNLALQKTSAQQGEVRKNAPVVYVYPLNDLDLIHKTVGVLAFQTPENVEASVGVGVAGLFRDVLLGRRACRGVMLLDSQYYNQQQAVDSGKAAGVDLVLAGRVNYQLAGYELGGDRLDVSLRLLDTRNGQTVWYIGQSLDKPVTYPDNGFWTRLRTAVNMPQTRSQSREPAVTNMFVRIAEDMTEVMAGARTVSRL